MWRKLAAGSAGATLGALLLAGQWGGRSAVAEPPAKPPGDREYAQAVATEALAKEFSLRAAARSLDASALHWQRENQCCQCHANFMYLVARPALAAIVPPAKEVREMFESLVRERW